MKQARIHIAAVVNASKIRREKRDGRDVIIVPSATLPDNVVMNGIRYPAAVIAESYQSLEGTLAPLGHPTVNGKYVSAKSAEGLARSYIGAHNENVRRENGRVLLDKVIDVAVANRSDDGKAVLAAIEKQEPMHTSTGLLATLKPLTNAPDGARFEATSMLFDHDCLFLDQPGAATPEQGVGIFVNSAGDEIEVVNSSLDDDIERDINWSLDSLMRAVERKERQPLLERIKVAIMRIVQGDPTPDQPEGDALNVNGEPMDKAQFDALVAKVDGLAAVTPLTEAKVAEIVGNALKPIADKIEADAKAAKDTADAEHAALANKVTEAGLLTEDLAKASPAPVLNALLSNAPRPAFRVNSGFTANGGKSGFTAPKGE